jgi:hypothetical protein
MSTQDDAARVAVLTALRDAIAEELSTAKEGLSTSLSALHKEHGTDRTSAVLPGGEKVATIAWVLPGQRFRVADPVKFAEWCLETHPSEVVTTLMVRATFQTVLLTKERLVVHEGAVVERDSGLLVEGVEAFEGAPYARVAFTHSGRHDIAEAWRSGDLDIRSLAAGTSEPQK